MPGQASSVAPSKVHESRHLSFPIARVWDLVRPLNFAYSSIVEDVKAEGALAEVGSTRKISYQDGTVLTVKLVELSDIEKFVTYEVIAAEPALSYSSAVHTIRLREVTFDGTTFIEWFSDYSNDANQEVIQDSKYKKQEAFEDLIQHLGSTKKAKVDGAKSPAKGKKK